MARFLNDVTTLYRVKVTYLRSGYTVYLGPYDTKSAAKGVATRERRDAYTDTALESTTGSWAPVTN